MKDTLNARFRAPLADYYKRRIIIWKDEAGEFADTVAELQLDNARILTMRRDAMFEIRKQIEVDYADENLLIYCPMGFERMQDNWLLDVFLYSEEFRADYWSLVFSELNVQNLRPVREYGRTIAKFFASKERRAQLRALKPAYANEQELQTGVFCVLAGIKSYGPVPGGAGGIGLRPRGGKPRAGGDCPGFAGRRPSGRPARTPTATRARRISIAWRAICWQQHA